MLLILQKFAHALGLLDIFFSIILMWNSDAIRWCFIYDNIHVSIKQIVLLNEKEKNQQTWNGYSIYLMFD